MTPSLMFRRALDAFRALPPLARLAVVCLLAVLVAYVAIGPSEDDPTVERVAGGSSTTAPERFGPVPTGGTGIVEVDGGIVLPVVGGTDGAWEVLTPCAERRVLDRTRTAGAHIVIDPGHGGEETGAIAPNGLTEAEINLDVARGVARRLEEAGAEVVLTRDADIRVTIETRAAIAQALRPLAFVSIHHNSGGVTPSDRPGAQVFHQLADPESRRLGGLVFGSIQERLTPLSTEWSRGQAIGVRGRIGSDGTDFYGILRRPAGVTSVLVEAMYLSGEPEANLLADPGFRAAEADAIADAIVTWVSTDQPGTGYLDPLDSPEPAGGGGGRTGCDDPPELAGP